MLRRALCLAVLAVALPAAAQTDASRIPDDAPEWRSMADAIARAQADGKLVLLHAYAAWCGWCVRMDQEVYANDDVQAYLAEHYTVTRLDIESDAVVPFFEREIAMAALGSALGVSGTPTTVFVAANGELITKLPGYSPPETFLHALRYVREAAYETMTFPEFVEAQGGAAPPAPEAGSARP